MAQPAVTAMGVMAFLSRGHLPEQGPYGEHIGRAIDFVLSTQRRRGYFSLRPVVPPAQHLTPAQTVIYNHAIAGLMLGEVYGSVPGIDPGKLNRRCTVLWSTIAKCSREPETAARILVGGGTVTPKVRRLHRTCRSPDGH